MIKIQDAQISYVVSTATELDIDGHKIVDVLLKLGVYISRVIEPYIVKLIKVHDSKNYATSFLRLVQLN